MGGVCLSNTDNSQENIPMNTDGKLKARQSVVVAPPALVYSMVAPEPLSVQNWISPDGFAAAPANNMMAW